MPHLKHSTLKLIACLRRRESCLVGLNYLSSLQLSIFYIGLFSLFNILFGFNKTYCIKESLYAKRTYELIQQKTKVLVGPKGVFVHELLIIAISAFLEYLLHHNSID